MDAMVLGEESFLQNATRTEYQCSGTYHVWVGSGMNLSILAFAIFWALRQVRVDPAVAAVSFAYAFVVGDRSIGHLDAVAITHPTQTASAGCRR